MMPSEPDKKMEDLLRTYARKRREDAGEPPVLHPATRRLLQAEAAKLRPREEAPKRTSWSWLLMRWPRVAFAVGLFALLSFAVWNAIPNRGRAPSQALFAKQDLQEKAAVQPSAPSRDEAAAPAAAAPKSQLRDNFEFDKDLAKRPQPAAITPPERSLDELRSSESLRGAGAPADVKLKKEAADRQLRLQQAPDDAVMLAEKETVNGPAENRVMVRKLAPAAPATRIGADQEASRPLITGTPKSGVNLSVAPSADAKAEKVGVSYSAPAEPTFGDSYGRIPALTQANTVTNSYQFESFNGGQGLGAGRQRQPTTLNRIPAPPAPTPSAPSILGFDTQSGTPKGGRADLGAEKRTDTGMVTLADQAQTRARAAVASASRPPVTTDATQVQALARQYYRFKRQTDPDQPSEAKVGKGSAPPSVMLTFDVAQDGDRVLVTDSDGSEYAGHFVAGAEFRQRSFGEIAKEPNRPDPAGTVAQRPTNSARRYSNAIVTVPLTTNRLFRVNGTNRTYGQLVTIEALLAGGPNASTVTSQWRGTSGATATPSPRPTAESYSKGLASPPASPPTAAYELLEAQRLVGKMRIGTSEEVNLIAVPVAR